MTRIVAILHAVLFSFLPSCKPKTAQSADPHTLPARWQAQIDAICARERAAQPEIYQIPILFLKGSAKLLDGAGVQTRQLTCWCATT